MFFSSNHAFYRNQYNPISKNKTNTSFTLVKGQL